MSAWCVDNLERQCERDSAGGNGCVDGLDRECMREWVCGWPVALMLADMGVWMAWDPPVIVVGSAYWHKAIGLSFFGAAILT